MTSDRSPYAAPTADAVPAPKSAPMFGYLGAGLASIFGLLIGGPIVLAMNFHAMGRARAAFATFVVAVGVFVVAGWGSMQSELPPALWRWPFITLWLLAVLLSMWRWQGQALAMRRAAGIRQRPWWLALGIGLLVNGAVWLFFGWMALFPTTVVL